MKEWRTRNDKIILFNSTYSSYYCVLSFCIHHYAKPMLPFSGIRFTQETVHSSSCSADYHYKQIRSPWLAACVAPSAIQSDLVEVEPLKIFKSTYLCKFYQAIVKYENLEGQLIRNILFQVYGMNDDISQSNGQQFQFKLAPFVV